MFPLFETIQIIDGIPQNLSYHQQRFEVSYFKLYNKLTSIRLKNLINVPQEYQKGIVKLRLLYNDHDCFCQFENYKFRNIKKLQLVYNDNIEYELKWTNRKPLEKLLLQKNKADDILIVKNNRITDTSFSNIVFYDGKQWLTPRFPLLYGTARNRLLNDKLIQAIDIRVDDLNDFKFFRLINAMCDFEKQPSLSIRNILMKKT